MELDISFDLDNTLIYTTFDRNAIEKLELHKNENIELRNRCKIVNLVDGRDSDKKGTGNVMLMLVVLRPDVQEFLNFCTSYFRRIYLFSAGQDRYVRSIDKILFPFKLQRKGIKIPFQIYSNSDCEFLTDGTTYKDLKEKGFDMERILHIDDREDTYSKNYTNGILIPKYEPIITKEGILKDDPSLRQLMNWLQTEEVKNTNDIRLVKKDNIFK